MHVDIIDQPHEFFELKREWDGLLSRSSTQSIFLTQEWLTTWWKHMGYNDRLMLVLVRHGNRLIAIAPLSVSIWEGFRHLGFVGNGTADYEDFIIDDAYDRDHAIASIFNTVLKTGSWDFFQFHRWRADSPNYQAVVHYLNAIPSLRWSTTQLSVAPFISIQSTWDDFLKSLSQNLRQGTARRLRRLAEDYQSIEFRQPRDHRDVDAFFDALVRLSTLRYGRARGDFTVLEHPALCAFYRSVTHQLFDAGFLDLPVLVVDDQIAAIQLNARYAGVHYGVLPAFDESFARYAVSRILFHHTLEQCFDSNCSEFDFLIGDEPYKLDYTKDYYRLMSVSAFPPTTRGLLAYSWFMGPRRWLRQSSRARSLTSWLRQGGILKRLS